MMKRLLISTAVIELGAGLVLMCNPSAAAALLLGSPLEAPAAVTLGRVAAVALVALSFACWFAKHDAQSRAARGVIAAMTVYNLGAVVVLGVAGVQSQAVGVALLLAVVLHVIMAAWCIKALLKEPTYVVEKS
jgi:hypothetical protein